MAYKKENKKMNTSKMSSAKNPKIKNDMDGTKLIPPMKKGRAENVKKETFSSTKKLKKK